MPQLEPSNSDTWVCSTPSGRVAPSTAKPWFMLVISTSPLLSPNSRHPLHRMVRAAVALMHLDRLRACRQREELVAEADAEDRHVPFQQRGDDRHGIGTRRGGVAGAVGQEHPVRLQRKYRVQRGLRRHHRHPRARLHEVAEDVVLAAVIYRDDLGSGGTGWLANSRIRSG